MTVHACDVADRTALAALLDAVPAAHPLTGVVHIAGCWTTASSPRSPRPPAAGAAPKADAALALHELTSGHDVAVFALFSSVAGVFGSAGRANYAAANCVLDALARHRGRLGLPGTSIAWGPWHQDAGMMAHLGDADRQRMARSGFAPLGPEEGLALFDAAVAGDEPVVVAARLAPAALPTDEPPANRLRTPAADGAGSGAAGHSRPLPRRAGHGLLTKVGPWRPASWAMRRTRARSTRTPCSRTWAWTPWPRSNCATSSRRGRVWRCRPRCSSTSRRRARSPPS
ncbi:KR domain-containing protein [Streptomyces albulus]|nr:KR domain-containing protein [Streptomyces noursei]